MGDFNLHHPLWDLFDRETYGAEALLQLAEDWGLQLITPYGTPTRRFQGQRNSTLDHAWVSAPNGAPIATYEGEGDYEGSDHRPQIIALNDDYTPSQDPQEQRFSWGLMDEKAIENAAKHLSRPGSLATPEAIDEAVDQLIRELTVIAEDTTPKRGRNPPKGGPSEKYWNYEVNRASKASKRARKAWERRPTPARWEAFREAQNAFNKTRKQASQALWRRGVQEASQNPKKLWTLERWARLRSHAPPEAPKMPSLRPGEGLPLEGTYAAKARILAARFFPIVTPNPDLLNSPPGASKPPFPFEYGVTASNISNILRSTSP